MTGKFNLRRKLKFSVWFLISVIFVMPNVGCEFNSGRNIDIVEQNFDDLYYWARDPKLSVEIAHSGRFCTYSDLNHPISQVFEIGLDLAYYRKYERVEISGWVFRPNDNTYSFLTAEIMSPDSQIVKTKRKDVRLAAPVTNLWTKVDMTFDIPKHLPLNNKLRVYLFAPEDGEKTFMDDMEIKFIR